MDTILDKTNDRTCKNVDCRKEHRSSEVARIFGKESALYLSGYCSAGCYTKDLTQPKTI